MWTDAKKETDAHLESNPWEDPEQIQILKEVLEQNIHVLFHPLLQLLAVLHPHSPVKKIRWNHWKIQGPVLRIRIRIHMFLGLPDPDPDPLVRGMDPDPSIIMQK